MSLLVVGLSHRSAPVPLLERAAVSGDALVKLLHDVRDAEHVAEAMVVSTCNRVEIYAEVGKFHGGLADVSELLARHSGVAFDVLVRHLYVHYEDRAVQHLFTVAPGLDSMVVGESHILGQVRGALRLAQREGTVGGMLDGLIQHALRVGKRVHAETGIDRAGPTLVSVGLGRAERELGSLDGRIAVIVGAGSMSALVAAALRRSGADVVVANRTYDRARRLAARTDARAVPLSTLESVMADAALVVSSTGAQGVVISKPLVARVLPAREGRPLYLLDLALPRDVQPAVGQLDGVTLVDLEGLRARGAEAASAEDVEAARRIVAEEVAAFEGQQRAASVSPTVVALRSRAAKLVDAELVRLSGRLPEMDDGAREEVARTVRRVVDKLLHAPTVRVKELASSPGGDGYAEALRELFGLDPTTPEAVARPDVSTDVSAEGERQ
ncbi:MAG: glutamyl-tRNA reductase [Streptosporangiaceae bacterium]